MGGSLAPENMGRKKVLKKNEETKINKERSCKQNGGKVLGEGVIQRYSYGNDMSE